MLGKILLTLSVIAIAYLYIRQQQVSESREKNNSSNSNESAEKDELGKDIRTAAYLLLFLMTGVGAALFYYDWRDDHQVLTVNLHRESQAEPVSYQVYKYQLQDRSFTTTDGIQITVASSERMEIIGLDD